MMLTMNTNLTHPNLTVQAPPWDLVLDDPTATASSTHVNLTGSATASPNGDPALVALSRYLPSNNGNGVTDSEADDFDIPVDAFSCDQFRMYEFKVRKCTRARSHDWTECPFAHPGEKARRRDPRKYHYSGTPCPDFRKGTCKKGDSCEYAHGVFECWLHPSRYRTQPCKDGTRCRRRVCFFAHTADQLRILPSQSESYDGSPSRLGPDSLLASGSLGFGSYSPSASPPSDSPPMSPLGAHSVSELAASLRSMQIEKARISISPPGWGVQMGPGFCSPRATASLRPGLSLPSTPTKAVTRFDMWEQSWEEEPVMERVESGRDLRARIYGKLSKENSLDRVDSGGNGPGVGWIPGLMKWNDRGLG